MVNNLMIGPPSDWVRRFAILAPRTGPVLDVACGRGRHLRLFHEAGHPVVGVDRMLDGVADLRGVPNLELVEADLEVAAPWPFGQRTFAAIVVTNYLFRPLFAHLVAAVGDGGLLIYETFQRGHEHLGRPTDPSYLLEPGELLEAVRGELTVIAYEQGEVTRPRPAVVQRIAAMRTGAAAAVPLPPAVFG